MVCARVTFILINTMKTVRFILFVVVSIVFSTLSVRANVYATDINLDGNLQSITTASSSPVTITYRLNQAATLGVTVAISQGATQVATIVGGTNMGLNTVVWGVSNNSGTTLTAGTFSVRALTPRRQPVSAPGSKSAWMATKPATTPPAPHGMAVDNNTNSPYYGRVVVGCSAPGGDNPVTGTPILDGIYKMNADGSFADEGAFGFGGYTNDDGGNPGTGEMPSMSGVVPWRLRIGGDDRIYMLDFSDEGAIIAFDMPVTTNQIVIDDGGADGGFAGRPP